MLIAFTPDGDDVVVDVVPLVPASFQARRWFIPAAAVREFRKRRRAYRQLLDRLIVSASEASPQLRWEVDVLADWIASWTWRHVAEPLISGCGPGRVIVDTTTLGPLSFRGAVWAAFRVGGINAETLLAWEFQNLYDSASAQRVIAWSRSLEKRTYKHCRICVVIPGHVRPGSGWVSELMAELERRARIWRVETIMRCDSHAFRELLAGDGADVLTVVVAHQDIRKGIELSDGFFTIETVESWASPVVRGDWGFFVCFSEDSLAPMIQRVGGARVWAMADYAFLDRTLATLLAWLEGDPHAEDLGVLMNRIKLRLVGGDHAS